MSTNPSTFDKDLLGQPIGPDGSKHAPGRKTQARLGSVAAATQPVASKSSASTRVQPAASERYLSDKDVAKRFGVSRPTVWRWTKARGGFPSPIQISPGTTRWRLSELLAFEATLARELDGDA